MPLDGDGSQFLAKFQPRPPARPRKRRRRLSEEEVVRRLEQLQRSVVLPLEVFGFVLSVLCPDEAEEPPLPAEPTRALPGTEERLAVMEEREANGEQLFHPKDAKVEGNDRLCILAARLRNGVAERAANLPVVRHTHEGVGTGRDDDDEEEDGPGSLRLHDRPPPARKPTIREGFTLPGEWVVVVGRVPPRSRRRRDRNPGPYRQRLLFEDGPFSAA